MAKVLFYHPRIENGSLVTAPLAFLHLATALRGSRHEMELLDGRLHENPELLVAERIKDKDAMFISAMPGSQILTALKACREARAARPDIPIVWGGPHPSLDPRGTIASPFASCVVTGRGEHIVSDLLDSLGDVDALSEVPNVWTKNEAGEVIVGPQVSLSDRRPAPPDYGLLDSIEPYICQTRNSSRMIDSISSFGCPHTCNFCCEPAISGSKWSAMDARTLVDSVTQLQRDYGVDGILFQDANFVADRERLLNYCRLLMQSGAKLNWIATARVSDIEQFHRNGCLQLMKDSGCEMLFIGAEAASEETIQNYNKHIRPSETVWAADLLWNTYGILPHYSYVISYPVEDMDAVTNTLNLHAAICEIVNAPTGELGFYNPTAGTEFLRENARHFNVPRELEGWSDFDFFGQRLYKEPSPELQKRLFRHHVNMYRRFPGVESYQTFDVWQRK